MTKARPEILFFGPLPPPVSGMPVVNQQMADALRVRASMVVIDSLPTARRWSMAYHLGKLGRSIRAALAVARHGLSGCRSFYTSADDGWGGIWNLPPIALARATGMTICIHHHSYRYIAQKTMLMAIMTRLAGKRATHVVLCDGMRAAFSKLYPAFNFVVTPNMVDEPQARERPAGTDRPFTIGLLSNLTFEKGLSEFVDILERALARGLDVRGVLAGPASTPGAAEYIEQRMAILGDRLEWTGPIEGQAKEDFFAAIDLFVFPTKYRTESFGLVLLEALVRGVPVVAPDRGCICLFAPLQAAEIVPLSADFTKEAGMMVERLATDRVLLAQLSDAAREEGLAMNRAHAATQAQFVDSLVAQARVK